MLADGKRQHDFDLMISVACFINQSFAGKFRPMDANPYRPNSVVALIEAKQRMSDEERKAEHKDMMQRLRLGLAVIARNMQNG